MESKSFGRVGACSVRSERQFAVLAEGLSSSAMNIQLGCLRKKGAFAEGLNGIQEFRPGGSLFGPIGEAVRSLGGRAEFFGDEHPAGMFAKERCIRRRPEWNPRVSAGWELVRSDRRGSSQSWRKG